MMKKTLRIAAAVLAIVMLLTAAVSCRSKQEKQEQRVVGTCGGFEVLYEELRYVTLSYKDIFAATYGEDIWDNPETAEQYRAELEEKLTYASEELMETVLAGEPIEDGEIARTEKYFSGERRIRVKRDIILLLIRDFFL